MITRIDWSKDAEKLLLPATAGDVAVIRKEVQSGISHLYVVEHKAGSVLMVTRGEGSELVVLCVAGAGMKYAGPLIIEAARKQGFKSIRYHCKNPAVQRLYQIAGIAGDLVERVYRKEIA